MHSYGMAEEAVLAAQGEGEAYVRGEWVRFRPGDMAFFPPSVEHAIRSTSDGPGLVAVASIAPPEFELYADAGLYNREYGVINHEAAWFARSNAGAGTLTGPSQLAFHDSDPHVRAENLAVDEIRSGGALFNVFSGATIDVIDAPMVFVLWPGYGARSTGFHFANADEGLTTAVHTHPASDECVVLWDGTARAWSQGGWHDMEIFDVVMAPCGVEHGIAMVPGEAYWGGFAAPPQLDMYARTPYYRGTGTFAEVPFGRLDA
jgi:gentisate 1,2-dioxygenase